MKYLILMALVFSGCATHKIQKEDKPREGNRASKHLLGITLGCAEMREEYGFTKEGCGDLWGKKVYIDWGNNE